jgi:hypothetical protein
VRTSEENEWERTSAERVMNAQRESDESVKRGESDESVKREESDECVKNESDESEKLLIK